MLSFCKMDCQNNGFPLLLLLKNGIVVLGSTIWRLKTMERLNPLNDYIFKRIMGEEESKENLILFGGDFLLT